jgi:hypothetical protein
MPANGESRKAARVSAGGLVTTGSERGYSVRITFLLKRWFSALKVQK